MTMKMEKQKLFKVLMKYHVLELTSRASTSITYHIFHKYINKVLYVFVIVHRTPFKKSLEAAFYFSRRNGRHQSLKDKCDTVLALTLVIRRRRFFLRTFFNRFIILFK